MLIEIARDGEEPLFIQVRAVGKDASLRAAFTGEP